jgi:hypothetical protein
MINENGANKHHALVGGLITEVVKTVVNVIEYTSGNNETKARQFSELNTLDINESFYNELNSWQIRVRIIRMKYLLGLTENTLCYCKIKIGDEEFKTKEKPIESLNYNEV